jgi:DNA polymerase III subunit epsilon
MLTRLEGESMMLGWIKSLFGLTSRSERIERDKGSLSAMRSPQNESFEPENGNGLSPSLEERPEIPTKVFILDTETTGIHSNDRIVSFAGITLDTAELADDKFSVLISHLIFDPGRKSHPRAEAVHGYSDWVLRHQEPFSDYADLIRENVEAADLIVAHNAEFDLNFLNREFALLGQTLPEKPVLCTMTEYRSRYVGKANLDTVLTSIGLARSGVTHGALEDAWLTMMAYVWLNKVPINYLPASVLDGNNVSSPTNMKPVPPLPDGPLPRRKRKSTSKTVTGHASEPEGTM